MTAPPEHQRPPIKCRRCGDRGAATVWMVLATTVIFAVAGLVHDGGSIISTRRAAIGDAEAAARAGAQGLDTAAVLAGEPARLDPADAVARAEAFIAANGWTGHATADPETVTVTIRRRKAMTFLSSFGIGTRTVTGTATARPQPGLAGP